NFVAPHILINGFEYKTPFVNSPFWDFYLSVPAQWRRGQALYREVLQRTWRGLFAVPTKSYYGLSLSAPVPHVWKRRARNRMWKLGRQYIRGFDWPALPMTNYMDMDFLLRTDADFKD